MTPLERAKAFVKSRAAMTALKIMPLALATVVGVSTKAHATITTGTMSGTYSHWSDPSCSGSTPCLNTKGGIGPSSSFSAYGTGGVQGSGSIGGTYGNGSTGQSLDLQLLISGGGTGNYGSDAAFKTTFEVDCPGCASTDTFSYTVNLTIDQSTYTYSSVFTPGTMVDPPVIIPTQGDDMDAYPWQATIDFYWTGSNGEQATFNPVDLSLDPNPGSGTPPVPEPTSMLLALSGLPLLGRLIRKKR